MRAVLGVIPARFSSKRFPGKALALIHDKPLIEHVYKRAQNMDCLDRVLIATDDERIYQKSQSFGADVLMTSPEHRTGTERVAEVAEGLDFAVVISIQGDEPLIKADMIESLVQILQDKSVHMATLREKSNDLESLNDPNVVKLVIDGKDNALYFSRSPIPFSPPSFFWKHIGVYGFQNDFLTKYKNLPVSPLEKAEKLEQLRVLENGYKIKTVETTHSTLSVNQPEDIAKVEKSIHSLREKHE
ncbi:MAG: 3-deoxy-manno-octulosonate cytidylyltransferase [Candidatus Aminicenantes bacterium]|nr:3-deoxy-manno-octulosonate cytidylyltransferase [Candidatus Aminicenantes bacterium]